MTESTWRLSPEEFFSLSKMSRPRLVEALGEMMSEISEDSYCAGWLSGIEDTLPPLLAKIVADGSPMEFGMMSANVSLKDAVRCVAIADALGHWVTLDRNGDFTPYHLKERSP